MKLLTQLNLLLVLALCHKQAKGAVMISPPGMASVCSGDQLELTCTTSGSILEWAFVLIPENAAPRTYTRGLTIDTQAPEPLLINSIRFTFSRLSRPNTLPLISILVINPVSVGLNGTEVNCTDVQTSDTGSTTITTINKDLIEDQAPEIDIRYMNKEPCKGDGVTVTLEWTQGNPLYTYHVNTVPQTIPILFSGNANVTLRVSYNTLYNVSVLAEHLCGDSNITIFTQLFYYASCGNPALDMIDENITVLGYREPAIEGSTVFFTCPPELELVGSRTSTCVGNGQWKPDPREVECKAGKELRLTTTLTDVEKISLASVTVSVVFSIIFFITGFLCRHYVYCQKEKHHLVESAPPPTRAENSHEDIQQECRVQGLELRANVAYENVPVN